MNDQEDPIKEEINPIEQGLSDLSVSDDQADEAKGGNQTPIKTFLCPSEPVISSNR